MTTLNNIELEQLSQKIRSLYILARRRFDSANLGINSDYGSSPAHTARWDGKVDSRGFKHRNIWKKIAQFTLTHKIDPHYLISSVFHYWKSYRAPDPTVFISEVALKYVEQYKKDLPQDLKISVENEKLYALRKYNEIKVSTGKSSTEIWRIIVEDDDFLSPIIKCCLAYQLGFNDLVDTLKDSAKMQYLTYKEEYDKALGENIPPFFRCTQE